MNERQAKLLIAIIDQFVETAVPVGSKQLLEHSNFCLSCATVRNEMRALGEEGFLEQPHVSAGRVPTAKGYQFYVKNSMQTSPHLDRVQKRFAVLRDQYERRKDQERVYEAIMLLSQMIPHVAFATVPHKQRVYYLGLANALKQPEFQADPRLASGVVEVLEGRLFDLLDEHAPDNRVHYIIGDEHMLPPLQSCSVLVSRYRIRDEEGHIGIIGPMRMDYAFNTIALEMTSDLLSSAF